MYAPLHMRSIEDAKKKNRKRTGKCVNEFRNECCKIDYFLCLENNEMTRRMKKNAKS